MRKNFEIETKTKALFGEVDNTINAAFKAADMEFTDMMENMDSMTGAMIGGYMRMLKTGKEYTLEQSKAIDFLVETIQDLKDENAVLRKNQEYLQQELRDLNRKVDKLCDKREKAE